MSYGISSILRFTGNDAENHAEDFEDDYFQNFQMRDMCPASPSSGNWYTFNHSPNDVFVCFTNCDNYQEIPLEYVKEKFQELGQGNVYVLGDPNIRFRGMISGTVLC